MCASPADKLLEAQKAYEEAVDTLARIVEAMGGEYHLTRVAQEREAPELLAATNPETGDLVLKTRRARRRIALVFEIDAESDNEAHALGEKLVEQIEDVGPGDATLAGVEIVGR